MSEFDDLAASLSCSRSEFEIIFNQSRTVSGTDSLPFMFVARGIGPDKTQTAFATALKYANKKDWLSVLWKDLVAAGYVTDSLPEESVTQLQQLCGERPGFFDTAVFSAGMVRRQKQVCLVVVDDGASKGSGFLVGPNAVITSGHVVKNLLNSDNQPLTETHKRIKIKFDHLSNDETPVLCNVLKDSWLLDYSPPHISETGQANRVTNGAKLIDSSLVDHLDFAVLGLASCPGNERGFVNLKQKPATPIKGASWLILQHPEAFEQQFDYGDFEGFREKTDQQRVLYSINTLPGSSGGLVVDNDFNFAALHQGAIPELDVNDSKMNTGIAAEAIRQVVKDVQTPDSSAVLQFRRSGDTGPIIGREDCQRWIHKSRLGNPRIVHVYTRSGTKGSSFSIDIMRACLPESEHSITSVSAGELGIEAITAAKMILDKLGINDSTQLPDPARVETTSPAWIKATLLPAFRERINQSTAAKMHWLVIDNIDSEPLPDSGVRLFLEALYANIESMPELRIVLIGLKQRPVSAAARLTQEEVINIPNAEEIERYICMRYVENQIDWYHQGGETNRLARLLDRTSDSDIVELDKHVMNNVDPMIKNSSH